MIENNTRYNRLVDSSPVPDIEGCNEIRFTLKTTGNTSKKRSFCPVPSVNEMTLGAFSASIFWVYNGHWNAGFPSLVLNEGTELMECPGVVDVPIAFPNGCPHPYAFEALDGYGGQGAFGVLYNLFRYDMVRIPGEPALFSGEFLKMVF